jgi:hypothetical protein
MQESTPKTPLTPVVSSTPFYLSLMILLAMIGLSIGFFFYNLALDRSIEAQKNAISETRKNIEEVSRDRKVIITRIEGSNTIRPSIDLKGIVADFYDAASRANVRLNGFNITNDVISTSLTATESNGAIHPDAASTIITMMQEYAQGK